LRVLVTTFLGCAALAALAPLCPRDARACAPAPPRDARVEIAAEEAAIVWNAETKTEHFIRRAGFVTAAPGFGFLVPTPTVPELAEAPNVLFDRLDEGTRPEVRHVDGGTQVEPGCLLMAMRGEKSGAAPTGEAPVRVLYGKRVAGFDAVVLEADDASALGDWLTKNGYDARPALLDWVGPYVAAKWKLTAFKIAKGADATDGVSTSAVRMSFGAERPFFPYREPSDQREGATGSRLLRVFVIGTGSAMEGGLGDSFAKWPGTLRWASPLGEMKGSDALAGLLPGLIPKDAWLTAFDDASSPRNGIEELFFRPAAATRFSPAPVVLQGRPRRVTIPLDLIVLVAGAVWLVVRLARKKNKPA
jgi:hypothetical protein